MKITRIDVFGYELTYAHGTYVMSGGRGAETQKSTVVRMSTDTGLEGWAEVAPLGGTYLPAFAAGIRAALGELGPALIGVDPTNTSVLHRVMNEVLLDQQASKSVIDIAAWDIKGKAAGMPVSTLLGGTLNEDFGLYEAVSLDTPENMVDYVRRRYEAGIRSFQLKVGNDPLEDAERTRAVAEAIGGKTRIIADANGGWDLHDAIAAARAMQGLPVYLEQPSRSLDDTIIVRDHTDLPLILDAAQELGLKVSMEDTWGGDLSAAAVSHLAASSRPERLLNVSFYNDWNLERVAGYQPRSRNGRGSAPSGAGLGINVDLSQLTELESYG